MPTVKIPQARRSWASPVSLRAVESAGAVRAALEELGWPFERTKTTRFYSKFALVIMLPKGAHVFQFHVKEGLPCLIETWETEVSPGALIAHLKVEGFPAEEEGELKRFLSLYVKAVGREPWRFTRRERGRAGYLLPEFSRARKAWGALGFDVRPRR